MRHRSRRGRFDEQKLDEKNKVDKIFDDLNNDLSKRNIKQLRQFIETGCQTMEDDDPKFNSKVLMLRIAIETYVQKLHKQAQQYET